MALVTVYRSYIFIPLLFYQFNSLSHLTNAPGDFYVTKTSQTWLSINEGNKRAPAIVISWCANNEGIRQENQERLKSDFDLWPFSKKK